MKITRIDKAGIDLIKYFEGFRSKPYLCPSSVATIGYGSTRMPNGQKVTLMDREISEAEAESFLQHDLKYFESAVDALATDLVNQNQFSALVSFCYNVGQENLKSSTLLKKVNKDPNDPSIKEEFKKWVYGKGVKLEGLVTRRAAEAALYFKK